MDGKDRAGMLGYIVEGGGDGKEGEERYEGYETCVGWETEEFDDLNNAQFIIRISGSPLD